MRDEPLRRAGEHEAVPFRAACFRRARGLAVGEWREDKQAAFAHGILEDGIDAFRQIPAGNPDDVRTASGEYGEHVFFHRSVEAGNDGASLITLEACPLTGFEHLGCRAFGGAEEGGCRALDQREVATGVQ